MYYITSWCNTDSISRLVAVFLSIRSKNANFCVLLLKGDEKMKTIPDYYEIIFAAFLKALRRETYTGTDMTILSGMMLYEGGY